MIDFNFARRQMIEQQVRAWDVLDLAVLETMERVPREEFAASPPIRDLAFADMNVPLGHGQHMLSPKLEGRILQALEIQPDDRVLEIGTGSGYFAACLGALAQLRSFGRDLRGPRRRRPRQPAAHARAERHRRERRMRSARAIPRLTTSSC